MAKLTKILNNVLQRLGGVRVPSWSRHEKIASRRGIQYFLITYDAQGEKIVSVADFTDGIEAERAYSVAEREQGRNGYQVVLFSADSIESVKVTHPHYFTDRTSDTGTFAALAGV